MAGGGAVVGGAEHACHHKYATHLAGSLQL